MVSDIAACLKSAAETLEAAGVETPALDARLLMQHALACTREALLLNDARRMSEEEWRRFHALIGRRAAREPLAQIVGGKEFYGREFLVDRHVLTPRPDSETLIEAVLERIKDRDVCVLDLGTGSGCLLLTLLAECSGACGVGVDISHAALGVARSNAGVLGLERRAWFIQGNWADALDAEFDVVIANPPYIPEAERRRLMPEVAYFEPETALFSGKDGLDSYAEIAHQLARVLAPRGIAALEVGAGRAC